MSWLAERLNGLLTERGLAIATVARDLAIERSHLTQIAAGSRTPNAVLTRRLAAYFDEDPDVWLKGSGLDVVTQAPALAPTPAGFVKVGQVAQVPPGEMLIVLDGRAVVANVEGSLFAFANVCPHAGGILGEGFLDGFVLQCPWHAGRWDIRTGEALTRISTSDVRRFEVRLRGEDIEVSLDGDPQAFPSGGVASSHL